MPQAIIIKDKKFIISKVSIKDSLGAGEIRVKQSVFGLNYDDLLSINKENNYIIGSECYGVIEEIGKSCTRKFAIGQRVCYCTYAGNDNTDGSFITTRIIHENHLMPVPDFISNEIAATCFKGLVTHMLLFSVYRSMVGQTILVTGASGAVGSFITQWASNVGINVIGLTSNDKKCDYIMSNGAKKVLNINDPELIPQILDITNGQGVNAVYDNLGECFYPNTLLSLRPLGIWINYGNISGFVNKFKMEHLSPAGLFLTTPNVNIYKNNIMESSLTILLYFNKIKDGILRPKIKKYNFKDIEIAMSDIKNSKTIGQKILQL